MRSDDKQILIPSLRRVHHPEAVLVIPSNSAVNLVAVVANGRFLRSRPFRHHREHSVGDSSDLTFVHDASELRHDRLSATIVQSDRFRKSVEANHNGFGVPTGGSSGLIAKTWQILFIDVLSTTGGSPPLDLPPTPNPPPATLTFTAGPATG